MLTCVRQLIAELPALMRAGLALTVLGGAIDIGYHVGSDLGGIENAPVAFVGHTVTLAGMVLTMFGLFGAALKRLAVGTTPSKEGVSR